jgi:RNA polymerase sigma factor (sigma-70 family)
MRSRSMNSTQRQLHLASARWMSDLRSDSELLRLFVDQRDEDAFTSIVGRYSRLVWGVCLRTLRDRTDAEDAYQAAFLRLAKDAAKIRQERSIAAWVHQAARCSSIDLLRSVNRHKRAQQAKLLMESNQPDVAKEFELAEDLDRILQQIPERYRTVLILCILDGRSTADVATHLGCSVATINRRLARAQEILRDHLNFLSQQPNYSSSLIALMGLAPLKVVSDTLEMGLVVGKTGVLPISATGTIAAGLELSTTPVASSGIVGVPTVVGSLFTIGMCIILYLSLAGTSKSKSFAETEPILNSVPSDASQIHGRVLRQDGTVVPGAQIVVLARSPFESGIRGLRDHAVGMTSSDDQGFFHLSVPHVPNWFQDHLVTFQISTPEHEILTRSIRMISGQNHQIIATIEPSIPLSGRLIDSKRKPIENVKVEPIRIGSAVNETPLNEQGDDPLPNWPESVSTDNNGRFTLPGLGGISNVWLRVHDPRYALDAVRIDDLPRDAGEVVWKLEHASPLEIEVRTEPDNQLLPFARLTIVNSSPRSHVYFCETERARTVAYQTDVGEFDAYADGNGKFCVGQALGQKIEVLIHPSDHSDGFVGVRRVIAAPNSTKSRKLSVSLPKGVWIHGRIHQEETGLPIPDATVQWSRPHSKLPDWKNEILVGRDAMVRTERDGSFRIAVLPEICELRVYGPTMNHPAIAVKMPGARSVFAHATQQFDAGDINQIRQPIQLGLQGGRQRSLFVEGDPVSELDGAFALISGRVSPVRPYSCLPLPVHDNQIQIPGCFQDGVSRVYLLNPAKALGKIVEFQHEYPSLDSTRLKPCGTVRVQFLDEFEKPIKNQSLQLRLHINRDCLGGKISDEVDLQSVEWFDPVHYSKPLQTNQEGKIELPCLIPDASYEVWLGTQRTVFGPINVGSGEVKSQIFHASTRILKK